LPDVCDVFAAPYKLMFLVADLSDCVAGGEAVEENGRTYYNSTSGGLLVRYVLRTDYNASTGTSRMDLLTAGINIKVNCRFMQDIEL
jgi:hypothetical protein